MGSPPFAGQAAAAAAAHAAAAAAASQAADLATWPGDVDRILAKAAAEGVRPPHPDVNTLCLTAADRAKYGDMVNSAANSQTLLLVLQGYEVRVSDMKRLAPQQMLNDELVSIYALLLQMRADRAGHPVCVLPASWYTMLVGRNAQSQGPFGAARIQLGFWGRKVRAPLAKASKADVATCNVEVWGGQRLVLVPIREEGGAHWLMTAVDVANRRFSFYDSFEPHDSQPKQLQVFATGHMPVYF